MGIETGIQWCNHTFNPWRGCTKVSQGCKHCYAESLSFRNPKVLGEWGPEGLRAIASESYWAQPLAWDRAAKRDGIRRRVFFSLGDWLEDHTDLIVPRIRMFDIIRNTPNLDWLLLTKRPENWAKILRQSIDHEKAKNHMIRRTHALNMMIDWLHADSPGADHFAPCNIWLGVSCEDQQRADERIPILGEIPAAVRFISFEPLLGPIATTPNLHNLYGGIHWAIIGGESGPNARPCDLAWIRSLVRQCLDADVATFVKQLGSRPIDTIYRADGVCVYLDDKKGGDINEFPDELKVREFPR